MDPTAASMLFGEKIRDPPLFDTLTTWTLTWPEDEDELDCEDELVDEYPLAGEDAYCAKAPPATSTEEMIADDRCMVRVLEWKVIKGV